MFVEWLGVLFEFVFLQCASWISESLGFDELVHISVRFLVAVLHEHDQACYQSVELYRQTINLPKQRVPKLSTLERSLRRVLLPER